MISRVTPVYVCKLHFYCWGLMWSAASNAWPMSSGDTLDIVIYPVQLISCGKRQALLRIPDVCNAFYACMLWLGVAALATRVLIPFLLVTLSISAAQDQLRDETAA